MLDPDCRAGKHASCVGDPCGCPCHVLLTRLEYLTRRAVLEGAGMMAVEAAASVALAHPEWDWGERRTWDDWERSP